MKSWTNKGTWAALLCCVGLVCFVGMAYADRPDNPAEPVDWNVLPNGLIGVQYDRTGDGVPDHITLHQVTWSGWIAQPMAETEVQARQDDQWMFIMDYEQDRYVYLARATPLLEGDRSRFSPWGTTARAAERSEYAPSRLTTDE